MPDPSRDGAEASPMEGSTDGPSQAEAATAEASPMEGSTDGPSQAEAATAEAFTAGNARPRWADRFERTLSWSRVVIVLPVIILVLSAFSSFAYGTDVFVRSVTRVVEDPHLTSHNIGFLLLLTDLFLVGATLLIAAFGLYSLFMSAPGDGEPSLRLPSWLRMRDLNDLKARVISMVILVAAVAFVDVVVESEGGLNTLYLGAAVALVIAALTAFLHFSR